MPQNMMAARSHARTNGEGGSELTICDVCPAVGEKCVPIERLQRALPQWAVRHSKFQQRVKRARCNSGNLPYATAQEIAWEFAFVGGYSQGATLAQDIARRLTRSHPELARWHDELIFAVESKIGRALGKFKKDDGRVVPYDFRSTTLYRYVYRDAVKQAAVLLAKGARTTDVDAAEGNGAEPGKVDPILVKRGQEDAGDILRNMAASLFRTRNREACETLIPVEVDESSLLSMISEAIAEAAGLSAAKRARCMRAVDAVRRSLERAPGHCVLMIDAPFGVERPVHLGTVLSADAARSYDKYQDNATMLTNEVAIAMDICFGLLADDPKLRHIAKPLAQRIVATRRKAYDDMYHHAKLFDIMPGIGPEVPNKWLGPPGRDGLNRYDRDDSVDFGWGIGNLPFLFGLRTPPAKRLPGLKRLLLPDDKSESPAPLV